MFVVRKATAQDANKILPILDKIDKQDSSFMAFSMKKPLIRAQIKQGNHVYIALDGNNVVGFARESGRPGNFIMLEEIYVDPANRGRGVGKELLAFIINEYPNIEMKVKSTNDNMLNLATSSGFNVAKTTTKGTVHTLEKKAHSRLRNTSLEKIAVKESSLKFEAAQYAEHLSRHPDIEAQELANKIRSRGFLIDNDISGDNAKYRRSYIKDEYTKRYSAAAAKVGLGVATPFAVRSSLNNLLLYNLFANKVAGPGTRAILSAGAIGESLAGYVPFAGAVAAPAAVVSSALGNRRLEGAVTKNTAANSSLEKVGYTDNERNRFISFSKTEFDREIKRLQKRYIDKGKKVPTHALKDLARREEIINKLKHNQLSKEDFYVKYNNVLEPQVLSYMNTHYPVSEELGLKITEGFLGGALANYPRWLFSPGAKSMKGLAASTALFSSVGGVAAPYLHKAFEYGNVTDSLINKELDKKKTASSTDDAICKTAGLKQLQRVLDAQYKEHITNTRGLANFTPKNEKIKKNLEDNRALVRDLITVSKASGTSMRDRVVSSLNSKPFLNRELEAARASVFLSPKTRLDKIKSDNRNISEILAQYNKDIDIKLSREHAFKSSKPEPVLSSRYYSVPRKDATIGMQLYHANQPSKFYYSSKDSSYLPEGRNSYALTKRKSPSSLFLVREEPPIWVSKHPQVASSYIDEGEHVFKFYNTKSLVKGGAPRDHRHLAADTRGIPRPLLNYQEFIANNTAISAANTKATADYERVLSFNPERFKENLNNILVRSKYRKAVRTEGDAIDFIPALYEASPAEKNSALPKLFSDKLLADYESHTSKLRSRVEDKLRAFSKGSTDQNGGI